MYFVCDSKNKSATKAAAAGGPKGGAEKDALPTREKEDVAEST